MLIKELIDYKGEVNLFTRPRRFGKTLNLSMLQYYFENRDEYNTYLFEGLKIMEQVLLFSYLSLFFKIYSKFKSCSYGKSSVYAISSIFPSRNSLVIFIM